MYAMLNVEFEVENIIRKILGVIYGLDRKHLELGQRSVKSVVEAEIHDIELVDSLAFDDALLVCACLERFGFRACRDYGVYQCGAKYGLIIKRECLSAVNPILQDLQCTRIIWKIASTILREWRCMFGKCSGDIYEALNLAYRIMVVRNMLTNRKCPSCGRVAGTVIKEAVHGRSYRIYAKKICCNHREKIVLGL